MKKMGFGAEGAVWLIPGATDAELGCHVNPSGYRHRDTFDACVLWELQRLWQQGVETACSCCGHGRREPVIGVNDEENRTKMLALGYRETTPLFPHCGDCVPYFFRAQSSQMCDRSDECV